MNNNKQCKPNGLNIDFIEETLKNAPEDLKEFVSIINAIISEKRTVGFEEGFILSDRLNQKEIDRLNNLLSKSLKLIKTIQEEFENDEDLLPQCWSADAKELMEKVDET